MACSRSTTGSAANWRHRLPYWLGQGAMSSPGIALAGRGGEAARSELLSMSTDSDRSLWVVTWRANSDLSGLRPRGQPEHPWLDIALGQASMGDDVFHSPRCRSFEREQSHRLTLDRADGSTASTVKNSGTRIVFFETHRAELETRRKRGRLSIKDLPPYDLMSVWAIGFQSRQEKNLVFRSLDQPRRFTRSPLRQETSVTLLRNYPEPT